MNEEIINIIVNSETDTVEILIQGAPETVVQFVQELLVKEYVLDPNITMDGGLIF